ncbi:glycosyltransferase [Psychroflexus sp. ALD_RP9]|uniref:glycosyltransferase n=1 Tax=Psychroflexus sp. ALD_RP9 TaxID=2777186 RepID=UPI001A90BD85|nr:glycosyltransferase [Psychroflexus sp. ALD_RP9]QSS96250.1 glycosyltransferase [Psychroflexus sp. ALD_RP9]
MLLLSYSLHLCYLVVIALCIFKLKRSSFKEVHSTSKIKFSILVPFKNEEKRIEPLLMSLNDLKYSRDDFEVIFINDHSTDLSVEVIRNKLKKSPLNFKIIDLIKPKSGKKSALILGVNQAKYDYIFTTDADCYLPVYLLQDYSHQFLSSKAQLVFGPVSCDKQSSFWKNFQYYDFLAIQAITKASYLLGKPISCNAANMAYKKESFKKVKPYQTNIDIVSGDDHFLLETFLKHNLTIKYLNTSDVVITLPCENLKSLLNQRKRWFSKSTHFKDNMANWLNLVLFLGHINLIIALVLVMLQYMSPIAFSCFVISKILVDVNLIMSFSKPYHLSLCVRQLLKISLIYPFLLLAFSLSLFNNKYIWK